MYLKRCTITSMSLSYVLFSVIYLFQRLDDKLRILNEAKESYMKARNEFAAKVGIIVYVFIMMRQLNLNINLFKICNELRKPVRSGFTLFLIFLFHFLSWLLDKCMYMYNIEIKCL